MLTSAVALLALTGCPDDGPGNGVNIASFTADPTSVASGGRTTLSWTVDNATSITIEAGGTVIVSDAAATDSITSDPLTADTTFTLTAGDGTDEVTRSVTVTVTAEGAPTVDSFAANPATIDPGASATLTWETSNATAVDVLEGATSVVTDGDADGSVMVTPNATTTYTLVAKAGDGQTAMAMVTVTVNVPGSPSIVSFMANPAAVNEGDSSTLSWNVMDADTVEITDAGGTSVYSGTDAMGTQAVSPVATTVYTITATNQVGMATDTVTVTVNPPQGAAVDAFTATPSTVMLGMSSDLAWMTTNANTVDIMAGGVVLNSSTDAAGTFTVTPTVTTDYTLMAINPAGNAMAMATVTVNASAPFINDFSAAPNPLAVDATVTLSWDVLGADTIRVLDGTTELANTTMGVGTVDVTVTSTLTTYTLEVANVTGGNTASVMVIGHRPAAINSFTATPMGFTGTATITLAWDVANVQNLTLTSGGVAVPGFTPIANVGATTNETGTLDVVVSADTTFTLNADSLGGADVATVSVFQAIAEVEPNDTATAAVSLAGAPVNGNISASGEGGDEDWYSFTVPVGGWVRAETSDGMGGCSTDTLVVLYDVDGVTSIEQNDDGGTGLCSIIDPAIDSGARNLAGGTYYVRVTGFATGDYQLAVTTGGPGCGNSIQETGESCDDGNTVNGDGCDSACNLEPVNTYTAPGAPATFAESITPAGDQDFYRIDVTATALVTVETFVDATAGTCPSGNDTLIRLYDSSLVEIVSDDDDGVGACSLINPTRNSEARLAPGTYFVRVEEFGNNGTIPAYEIVFSSVAGDVCGNGFVEPTNGEICDDGNVVPGDGCNATCQPELLLDYAAPGALATATSSLAVATQVDTIRITATSSVYIVAETIQDAQAGTCATLDTRLRLRDSTGVEIGNDDADGVGSCSFISPADGFARVGPGVYFLTIEEDGQNAVGGDYTVAVQGLAVDVCGNGVAEGTEQCDDGNTTPGDGCSATCTQEVIATYTAPGAPATYTNAIAVVGEQDIFQITVTAESYLTIETFVDSLQQTCPFGNDTVIRLLDSTFTQIGTDDEGGINSCSRIDPASDAFARLTPGTYYLQVEEYLNNATIATYDVVFESAQVDICGNGVVDNGGAEQCDDGNVANGDGCSSTCQIEGTAIAETEPNNDRATANSSTLAALGTVTVTGTIDVTADVDYFSFVVPAGGADLTAITYTSPGNTATCASGTDTRLYLQDSAGTDILNNDDGNPAGTGLCSLISPTPLTAGTYYIRVQYWSGSTPTAFPYLMDITLQ